MEIIDFSLATILVLIAVAIIAGFIDTLVGGGGLITIPALLAAGMPPIYALGTNKLQAVAGTGTASLSMILKKQVDIQSVKTLMLTAFIGSLVGTVLVQFIDSDALNMIIPIVILLIAVYFVLAPTQSVIEREPRISKATYGASAVPAIGFYDGMFGPGTGSFFVLAGVSLRGQPIVRSTAVAKTLNFSTNLASLCVFVYFAKLVWFVGLVMMIGQAIGASLGSKVLLTIDPSLLRYLVIVMSFTILIIWALNT